MNKPKAARLGLCMALTVIAAIVAFAPSAFATITDTASTTYGSTVPGAHTDYTIRQDFTYDANGPEPTGATGGQDLKKWIVDSPAGLVGNPNAIPEADRCDPAAFDPSTVMSTYVPGTCPASAKVGDASVYLVNDAQSGTCPNAPIQCLTAGFDMSALGTPMLGSIYILKTNPEVPTTLGTLFSTTSFQALPSPPFPIACGAPPCPLQPKTKSVLAPVTNRSATDTGSDDDFRIRTIPADYSNPPAALLPTAYGHASYTIGGTPLHIRRIDQHLYGMVGGQPFLTMPARCDSWDSKAYAFAWNGGGGSLAMDPNHPGDNTYVQTNTDSVIPDCSTLPAFGTSASSSLSTGARGAYPGLTVKVGDPSPSGHDQVKKMVTTLPSAVSVNVNALNNVCSEADRDADTCPAAAKIGTASIKTPLISAGLTGRVYMVKGTTPGLPFLSIYVDGAVQFRLDATTRFVGPAFNMIETTFDNLPQTPFTDFTVAIAGGSSTSSLLFNRSCPVDGSSPDSGSTGFALTGYANGTVSSNSSNSFDGCYGVSNPSKIKNCVKVGKKLKVKPKGLIATGSIAKVTLRTGSKSKNVKNRATDRTSPFSFKLTLKKSKYKANKKYYYAYKVYYKDGNTVKTKTNTFRTCKK